MYFKHVFSRLISALLTLCSFAALSTFSMPAAARSIFGVDYGTLQENWTSQSLSSLSRSSYNVYINLPVIKDSPLGISVGYCHTDSFEQFADGNYSQLSTELPYVGLTLHLGSPKNVSLIVTAAYSPYLKTLLKQKPGQEEWQGIAFLGKLTLEAPLSSRFKVAASLAFLDQTFDKKITGSLSSASKFTQTYMLPLLGVNYNF